MIFPRFKLVVSLISKSLNIFLQNLPCKNDSNDIYSGVKGILRNAAAAWPTFAVQTVRVKRVSARGVPFKYSHLKGRGTHEKLKHEIFREKYERNSNQNSIRRRGHAISLMVEKKKEREPARTYSLSRMQIKSPIRNICIDSRVSYFRVFRH